ncbi:hypothetical protein BC629DRAFT_1589681 [Irpex lacteus]|nr:hypothetical protein BC629DRAFT_1589681 [Irpex lacteus]
MTTKAAPPRGILKNSPSHQPRTPPAPCDHPRHVTMTRTDSSSSLESTSSNVFVARPDVDASESYQHTGGAQAAVTQSNSKPSWMRVLRRGLLSALPSRRARIPEVEPSSFRAESPAKPAMRSVRVTVPAQQPRSTTPVPPPSSYRDPMHMVASQISLPVALPKRRRALSDVGTAPVQALSASHCNSGSRETRRRVGSPHPIRAASPTLLVTRGKRLGSFDFER